MDSKTETETVYFLRWRRNEFDSVIVFETAWRSRDNEFDSVIVFETAWRSRDNEFDSVIVFETAGRTSEEVETFAVH